MSALYLKKWEKTKKEYEDLTDQKKPREKVVKLFRTTHTGLSATLKKCVVARDKVTDAMADQDVARASVANGEFTKALMSFVKAKDSYITVLDRTIQDEKKTMDTREKIVMDKGLHFLRGELQALTAEMTADAATAMTQIKAGLRAEKVDQALLKAWVQNLSAGIARCMAEIAKVSSNMTVANYNARIWVAARDLFPEVKRAKQIPNVAGNPKQLTVDLAPYSKDNGVPAILPDDTTPQSVKQHLIAFTKLVQRAQQILVQTRKAAG